MTESNQGGGAAPDAAAPEKPAKEASPERPAKAAAEGRGAKWRRRLRRLAVAAVIAVLLFRLALSVLLPTVVHRSARAFGFDLTYGRLDLNLLGTQAGIWDVSLRAKDQPDRIAHADYAFANISSLALFKLKLRAYRLEVDGMQVDVVRKPDGTIPVLEQLAAALASKEPPPPAEPLSFESPLAVEAVRVHHVKVSVRDESVSPPFEDAFTFGLRVSDVGNPAAPATIDLELFSKSTLQALRLQGQADLRPEALSAKLTFSMYGLRLNDAQAYLASLGARTEDLPIALTGAAEVTLKAIPAKAGALAGVATVRDVRLAAGQEDAVRLDRGEVSIRELSPSSLHVSRVEAGGGMLRLCRTPEGAVTFASFSQAPAPPVATRPVAATGPASAPSTAPAGTPFSWRLDGLVATDLKGEFRDRLPSPERRFEAVVRTFEVKNLASSGGPGDSATLALALAVPGIADEVRITGSAKPFADRPAATVVFDASGVKCDALGPYLAPLGVEPLLGAGRFRATLEASAADLAGDAPTVGVTLRDVRLDDREASLLTMPLIRIAGLRRDPATGAIDVAEIAATGPSLTVKRIGPNTIELPGFRYRKPKPTAASEAAPIAAAGAGAAGAAASSLTALPVVRVGKITWGGANVRLEDRSEAALEPIDLSDARLEVEGFVLDQRPDAPPAPPGKVSGRFSSPGLVGAIQLDGTLTPGRGSMAADLALRASGLKLTRLAPILTPFGIEPRLADGSFNASARAAIEQKEEMVRVSADVSGIEMKDGEVRLIGIERAGVDRVELSKAGYAVGEVAITRGYARVERDADGGLIAGGVKLLPPAPATQPSATQPAVPGAQPAVAMTQPATQPVVDPFAALAALPPIAMNSLKVDGAELDWLDRSAPRPVELKLAATGSIQSLALNQPQPAAATYEWVVSSPQIAERIRVAGTIEQRPDSLAVTTDLDAAGLKPEALAPYLPEGMEPGMRSGSFKATSAVVVARHPEGGLKASATVDGVALRDGGADDPPLAAVEKLNVTVDRFDPATGDLALGQVSLAGAEAATVRGADGAISAFGVRLVPPKPDAPAATQPAAPAPPPPDGTPASVAAIVAESQEAMPLLSLQTLDLHLKRVSFRDDLRKAAPVALSDFRVSNDGPIQLLGEKPESNPPIKLRIAGGIDPVVKQLTVLTEASPFAERTTARVTVEAAGIDGDALTRVAPELAETFDGKGLADGRFQTGLEVEANVRRRGATRIDLSRGLELSFSVTKTALRAGESGPVLAAVGLVRGEQVKVETRTGDLTVRSLEVADLAANAWRDADGIHVLGMRIKGTEPKPDKPDAPPKEPAEPEATVASQVEPGAPAAGGTDPPAPKPEVRIDRLSVSGLDFRFEDRALDPPVVIPITSLDADVRGLSSLLLERERPVKFNVSLGAGKVALPKKLRGGTITGALADAARLAGGKQVDTKQELEERDFFAQIVAAGDVRLYPKPAGRAQASMNGVELAAIRGLAAPSGIGLNGGTFDGRVEVKTREDQKLDVRSRFVVTDLSVSEPANGPIVRYLALPAPLDVVIGAVEAPDKSITLPLHFQVDGTKPEGIVPAAAGAVSGVLVTAVASAPVKVVTGVVGLFGDTTKEMEVVEDPPVYLEYAPGVASLDPASQRTLERLLAGAKRSKHVRVVVEHELGQDDVAVAAQRANPPRQQVAVFTENLRGRRREMLGRRDDLFLRARAAALSTGPSLTLPDESLVAYRDLQRELADVDDALDRLYDLQRPGAERQADRRTRSAALELADARLARVRANVKALGDAAAAERVRVGVPRFAPGDGRPSRLVINVARAVPRSKRSGGTSATARAQ